MVYVVYMSALKRKERAMMRTYARACERDECARRDDAREEAELKRRLRYAIRLRHYSSFFTTYASIFAAAHFFFTLFAIIHVTSLLLSMFTICFR